MSNGQAFKKQQCQGISVCPLSYEDAIKHKVLESLEPEYQIPFRLSTRLPFGEFAYPMPFGPDCIVRYTPDNRYVPLDYPESIFFTTWNLRSLADLPGGIPVTYLFIFNGGKVELTESRFIRAFGDETMAGLADQIRDFIRAASRIPVKPTFEEL